MMVALIISLVVVMILAVVTLVKLRKMKKQYEMVQDNIRDIVDSVDKEIGQPTVSERFLELRGKVQNQMKEKGVTLQDILEWEEDEKH